MEAITHLNKEKLRHCIRTYNNWISDHVDKPVKETLRIRPEEIATIFKDLGEVERLLSSIPNNTQMAFDSLVPKYRSYLKQALIYTLRAKTVDKEERSHHTHNRKLREILEREVKEISEFTESNWFKATVADGTPKLTDYLSIQYAEELLQANGELVFREREYDEKFHILNAPSLFLDDLKFYRTACELRNKNVSIAYIDIDNFKKNFNDKYGESRVDRDVLPRFMSELESNVFSHGHAYRFGGDEYVVLLPNMSAQQASIHMAEFQRRLDEVAFFEINERIIVSIGICELSQDCALTDNQSLEKAEQAKNHAKDNSRNCIFVFNGSVFMSNDYVKFESKE